MRGLLQSSKGLMVIFMRWLMRNTVPFSGLSVRKSSSRGSLTYLPKTVPTATRKILIGATECTTVSQSL